MPGTSSNDGWQNRMARELNYELQQAVAARERSRREGKLISISELAPKGAGLGAASVTPRAMANCTYPPSAKTPGASRAFGISAPVLYGALLGAAPAIVTTLIVTYQAPAEEQINVWKQGIPAILASLGLGGGAAYLKPKIYQALVDFGPKLLNAEKLGFLASLTKCSGSLAQATIEVGFNGILGFFHCIRWAIAKNSGDEETGGIEENRIKDICSVDNAVTLLAHVIAVAGGNALPTTIAATGTLGSGPMALVILAVPAIAWVLSDTITHAFLQKKKEHDGWVPMLKSLVWEDRRPNAWYGENFHAHMNQIPEDLTCPITQRVVVDPVRSTFTGALYERHAIFRWLDEAGRDPIMRGERATRLDYIPAPVAKRWAHKLATEMGAYLALEDSY